MGTIDTLVDAVERHHLSIKKATRWGGRLVDLVVDLRGQHEPHRHLAMRIKKKNPYQRFMPQGSYHWPPQPVKMRRFAFLSVVAVFCALSLPAPSRAAGVRVAIVTDQGEIDVNLDAARAPITVKNFLGSREPAESQMLVRPVKIVRLSPQRPTLTCAVRTRGKRLVGHPRIELGTSRLSSVRSNQLS
jgi:hypothetical protein